jgi:hypothetical protein
MKNSITIRWFTIPIAIIFSVFVEYIPTFIEEEKPNRVCYALIAIILTILIENYINHKRFKNSILNFIGKLKKVKVDHGLKPKAIQDIMKASTFQIAGILEQSEKLNTEFEESLTPIKHTTPCSICDTKHETNSKSKCKHCRLDNEFWNKAIKI